MDFRFWTRRSIPMIWGLWLGFVFAMDGAEVHERDYGDYGPS